MSEDSEIRQERMTVVVSVNGPKLYLLHKVSLGVEGFLIKVTETVVTQLGDTKWRLN